MNKPSSFLFEPPERAVPNAGLLASPRAAVPVCWHRPLGFAVSVNTVNTGRITQFAVDDSPVAPLLQHSRCAGGDKPRLVERFLRRVRAALLALALLPLAAPAQSLWKDDVSKPMFADKRAAHVGDILTLLVQESTATTKDNSTKTGKSSGLDASLQTFLYSPAASGLLTKGGSLPAMKFNSKSDFGGGGSINNSEKISARAAVRVMDVLPNGNLVIEGRRDTAVGGEQQTMILRGVVRAEDVAANNTVYSYNVADATIQILSKGTITDSQRKGWAHKIWDKVSPF